MTESKTAKKRGRPKKEEVSQDEEVLTQAETNKILLAMHEDLQDIKKENQDLKSRLRSIETGGAADLQVEDVPDDVEQYNRNIPDNIREIVAQELAVDFAIKINKESDPFQFMVRVPDRLRVEVPKKDQDGNVLALSPDWRNCGYNETTVRQRCILIKGNILKTFQDASKPTPEIEIG
jgi:hypothetical protein